MLGVRFRLQGRDARHGLDCVGLVWAAYAAAGVRLKAPCDYPIRGWSAARVRAALDGCGLEPVADSAALCAGDVALLPMGAGQFHLAVLDQESAVHAHAGLRRVVESPLADGWAAASRWRHYI